MSLFLLSSDSVQFVSIVSNLNKQLFQLISYSYFKKSKNFLLFFYLYCANYFESRFADKTANQFIKMKFTGSALLIKGGGKYTFLGIKDTFSWMVNHNVFGYIKTSYNYYCSENGCGVEEAKRFVVVFVCFFFLLLFFHFGRLHFIINSIIWPNTEPKISYFFIDVSVKMETIHINQCHVSLYRTA